MKTLSLSRSCRFLGLSALLSVGFSTMATLPALAANFTYQDASTLELNFDAVEVELEGNVRRVNNYTIINTGDSVINDAAYVRPFAWSIIPGVTPVFDLTWENERDGWFTEDYDGQGNSLLITLISLSERIRLGDIADLTGESPLPLVQPCDDSPSCLPLPFPASAQSADDEVPFLSFGSLAPGESKSFDLVFDFDFEDGRAGTLPIAGAEFTLQGSSTAVPEPTTALALVAVAAVATQLKRKERSA